MGYVLIFFRNKKCLFHIFFKKYKIIIKNKISVKINIHLHGKNDYSTYKNN